MSNAESRVLISAGPRIRENHPGPSVFSLQSSIFDLEARDDRRREPPPAARGTKTGTEPVHIFLGTRSPPSMAKATARRVRPGSARSVPDRLATLKNLNAKSIVNADRRLDPDPSIDATGGDQATNRTGGTSRSLVGAAAYSTVTLLARLRGLSTLQPRRRAAW